MAQQRLPISPILYNAVSSAEMRPSVISHIDKAAISAGLVLFFGLRAAQSLGRVLVVIYMRRPHPSVAKL